jgi:TolA-binding protein
MTRVDLHPEDLLDRALNGLASKEDMARLESHFESCNACRLEHALAMDCRRSAASQPDDLVVLDNVRLSVVRAFERERLGATGYARRRGPRRFRFLALAAFLLLGAAGAAVVVRVYRGREVSVPTTLGSPRMGKPGAVVAQSLPARAVAAAPVPSSLEPTAVIELPPIVEPPPDDTRAVTAAEHRRATSTSDPVHVTSEEPPASLGATASELFARANSLRRGGQTADAVHAYRALEQSFPGSPEALVSRVTLGRLLLDRGIDVRAALVEFDAYLSRAPKGPLAEEALIGRALSLGRLGRTADERGAWRSLLATHPKSTYAARAQARIEQLSTTK